MPALVLPLGLPLTPGDRNLVAGDRANQRAALAPHLASGSIDWIIATTFTAAAVAAALAGRRLGAIINFRRLGQLFALLLVAIAVVLVAENVPAYL